MTIKVGTNSSYQVRYQTADTPSPTITTTARKGGAGWISITGGDSKKPNCREIKPLYRVPSMAEIAKIQKNGYIVASTFSGCGGSCLGYRMAGFDVAWANEMEPNAAECHLLNFPDTIHDRRDIRIIKSREILDALGIRSGELDLLDGSPPCQSFSTSGKLEKGWGKVIAHSDGTTQRSDDLFFEFIRILDGLKPKIFIAENVSGLIKGRCKGYFKEIFRNLKTCGYIVGAQLLDAQWLGVPQMRQRIIFIGVREDLKAKPIFPQPLPYRYSVSDVLPSVTSVPYLAGGKRSTTRTATKPCPSVLTSAGNIGGAPTMMITANKIERRFTIQELKRICSFPDDFILVGSYAKQWARLGNSVPPLMAFQIGSAICKVRDEI